MAAEPLLLSRRLLLLMLLVLPISAALAGGVAASLLLRGTTPPASPAPRVAELPQGCEAPAHPALARAGATPDIQRLAVPAADPGAALDMALGRPMARPAPPQAEPLLASLLAPVPDAPQAAAPPAPPPQPAAPQAAAPAAPAMPGGYTLDLGYFLVPEHATAFAARVQERGVPVQLRPIPDASGRVWTHVRTPPFAGSAQALAGAERVERSLGIAARLVPPERQPAGGTAP